jgi:hypothetical protein
MSSPPPELSHLWGVTRGSTQAKTNKHIILRNSEQGIMKGSSWAMEAVENRAAIIARVDNFLMVFPF